MTRDGVSVTLFTLSRNRNMQLTLKEFKSKILPMLQEQVGDDSDALQKAIHAFLKQGESGEVPVMNENGEPVEISEVILVGAPASTEEEPEEEMAEAEFTQASIDDMVQKAVSSALKTVPHAKRPGGDPMDRTTKASRIPATAKRHTASLKCFKGPDAEYKAYGFGRS